MNTHFKVRHGHINIQPLAVHKLTILDIYIYIYRSVGIGGARGGRPPPPLKKYSGGGSISFAPP